MIPPSINNPQLLKFLATFWQWRGVWLATTGAFAACGIFYALCLKSDTWVASQAIIVRDEANGAVMRLGRFESQTEMKAAQETILEMAHNIQVIGDALQVVGHEPSWSTWLFGEKPLSTSEIESLSRTGVIVRAPRGAELGTTEVIYLDVKQPSPERAVALNRAVCDALEKRLKQVRQARADGVIAELQTAKLTVQQQLQQATVRLTEIESDAGTDLSDLRGMTDSGGGGSSSRVQMDNLKAELRQAELQLQQLTTDFNLAVSSSANPDELTLTPTAFTSQPGLKALRDGLAAATINTSQVLGRYTRYHPLVQAAEQAEANLREQLRNELKVSVQSLRQETVIASGRVDQLKSQLEQLQIRLQKLARIRAEYANVAGEVRARSQQLQDCERDLAQAQASREAALTSSLITRLDQPVIGEKPLGPGRTTIMAASAASGLLFGLGIVFLLSPWDQGVNYGRRRFDYSGLVGRRATDRDQAVAPEVPRGAPVNAAPEVPGQGASPRGIPQRRAADRAPQPPAPTLTTNTPTSQPAAPEFWDWARPVQLSERLGQIVHNWRTSQRPIQPQQSAAASDAVENLAVLASGRPASASGPVQSLARESLARESLARESLAREANLPPQPTGR